MAMAPHRRRRRSPPSSPPRLPDHLFEDIFFRLPPEDPSCLLRASLVCKHWRYLICHPRFVRYLHAHRRAPQMLGFLQNSEKGRLPTYVPTSPFPFYFPFPDRGGWHVFGYRHGRALFSSKSTERLLLVWEPFTGERWEVMVPADFTIQYDNATVLCAADGCDHLNCHGGAFRVVLVFCAPDETEWITSACVYSSETGAWGRLALRDGYSLICDTPGLLVGNSLIYFLSIDGYILEYDLARHVLDVILPPDHDAAFLQRVMLVQAEHGVLGIVEADDEGWNRLYRWSRVVSEEGDAQWVERPVMYLDESLPYAARTTASTTTVILMGFVEGANTILVRTDAGFFTVELHSKRATKVCKNRCIWYPLVPIVSSYTLGSTLEEQHNLRFSDESDGEEWEDKEVDDQEWEEAKALRQTELLFNKGSMALEKGDFVGAVDSFGHVLKLRFGFYSQKPFSTPNHAEAYMQMYCARLGIVGKSSDHFNALLDPIVLMCP